MSPSEDRTQRLRLMVALALPSLIISSQLYAVYRASGMAIPFAAIFAIQLCHWEPWVVFGPLVWSLEARWPLDASPKRRAVVMHAMAAPLIASAVLVLYFGLYHALIRLPFRIDWFTGLDRSPGSTALLFFATTFHVDLLVYVGVIAAAHASRTSALLRVREQQTLRLEADLVGAKLATLRTQLQPHFLFNALHTIGSLVLQRENGRATQLLAELGDLLRATLAHRETDLAPLSEELTYLRRYLKIEEVRFGDRLRVELAIDPTAAEAALPPFILQPIVENAFRHGISRRTESCLLQIAASLDGQWLRVAVYNDGPPLAPGFSAKDLGYGLTNVTERLRTRRPPGRVEFANEGSGVRVTLLLPLLTAAG